MELFAIINGLRTCSKLYYSEIVETLYSDSAVSIGRLRDGWGLANIPELMVKDLIFVQSQFHFNTIGRNQKCVLLDGHPTKAQLEAGIGKRGHLVSKWNVLCDKMCNEEAERYVQKLRDNDSR